MILVDTSIWIDHFRKPDARLVALLENTLVLTHPIVIGELALGRLGPRRQILAELAHLPSTAVAADEEVLAFIETDQLQGSGIGYIDAHLLVATKLTPGTVIWTRDKNLRNAAAAANIAMRETPES